MRVVVHPEAAGLWYEEQQAGLGLTFLEQFERTVSRVTSEPERWRKFHGDNRKLNFQRFPYAVIYGVRPGIIHIKAVMHLHRQPFYWKKRA